MQKNPVSRPSSYQKKMGCKGGVDGGSKGFSQKPLKSHFPQLAPVILTCFLMGYQYLYCTFFICSLSYFDTFRRGVYDRASLGRFFCDFSIIVFWVFLKSESPSVYSCFSVFRVQKTPFLAKIVLCTHTGMPGFRQKNA